MKRDCDVCTGSGVVVSEGDTYDCYHCGGKGEVEGCICFAREPFECSCGGWDDVDIDQWYGDDY
jgi:hypothetical protein